ncbi:hypothetical protein Q9233_002671 [Columba guinea]|nr:hypothetical protein Q9233_002671 [Columba guinea]
MFSSGVTYILAVVKGNLRTGTEALKSPLEHLFSNQLQHTTPGIANTLLDKIQVTTGLNLKKINQRDLLSFADSSAILALFGDMVAAGARDTPHGMACHGTSQGLRSAAVVRHNSEVWQRASGVKRRISCDPADISSVVLHR